MSELRAILTGNKMLKDEKRYDLTAFSASQQSAYTKDQIANSRFNRAKHALHNFADRVTAPLRIGGVLATTIATALSTFSLTVANNDATRTIGPVVDTIAAQPFIGFGLATLAASVVTGWVREATEKDAAKYEGSVRD